MNSAVKIVGLELLDEPSLDGKSQHLAHFTCELSGLVRLAGCTLLRFNSGHVRSFPPRTEKRRGGESAVYVLDDEIREAMTEAAHRAYRALGGAE